MRTPAFAIAFVIGSSLVAGCLSAPTGLAQSWPPVAGVTVVAIATGDLDGDGVDDLVAVTAGSTTTAGVYFMSGSSDYNPSHDTPAKSFTTYVPLAITGPAAAAIVKSGTTPMLVIEYNAGGAAELRAFTGASLTQVADVMPAGALLTGSETLSLELAQFPDAPHLIANEGAQLEHFDLAGSTPGLGMERGVVDTGTLAVHFNSPQAVFSTGVAPNLTLFVSEANAVYQSPVAMGGFVFQSQSVWRTTPGTQGTPAMVIGATATQLLPASGSAEVVFAATRSQQGQLCAIDVATSESSACVAPQTGMAANAIAIAATDRVQVFVGAYLGDPSYDSAFIVVGSSPNSTVYGFPKLIYSSAGTATLTSMTMTAGQPPPKLTLSGFRNAQALAVGSSGVLLMSDTGDNQCQQFETASPMLTNCE